MFAAWQKSGEATFSTSCKTARPGSSPGRAVFVLPGRKKRMGNFEKGVFFF